ncbi:fatty acid-2 hydroxylase [Cystobasidium minutum MCA 4210]|uniref:fatty acid-2 hydroxylase n=1 Tax=Cystobasidium minutum MCA 4210 TaxID=1397322 RepID=UPI0034CE3FBE|eukprot:jgi/Rhomi1/162175/estExt_Genewise1Plus.C_5_t20192
MSAISTATKRKPSSKRIYTLSDVERHNTASSCWVIRNNVVYDVTAFVADHPGGDDLILDWAGKDITAVMEDPVEHAHSDSAYDLLSEYSIGVLLQGQSIVDENIEIDEDFQPEDTDSSEDYSKNQFLDLSKPLIMQVWYSNWSKDYYLQQVHQPRHLPQPARLFGPWYLEMFTRTQWWIVPLIWGPITLGFLYNSYQGLINISGYSASTAPLVTLGCFLFGNLFWTFIEYFMHRFLFHIDDYLPDHQFALLLHFLLHGIHHYLPMDRLRLVMPPILFAALSGPFLKLAHAVFPAPYANGVIAGSYAMYICYDCMHYALHHTKMPQYMKQMKVYHLQHHWKNYELGFGVTSKLWDYVFNTELR